MMYSMETAVVEWSNQVNECLEQHSGQLTVEGQFPLPIQEYEFWRQRMTCMHDIYDQLVHPQVKKMAIILEQNESAYSASFKEMFKKVVRAVVESETIVVFLTPLMNYLNDLENTAFDECRSAIQPIVHMLALIWVNCQYYRKTEQMVILITEIGNLLIQQCRTYLDPSEIVKEEPDSGMKKINEALDTFNYFKLVVDEYRTNVKESCIQQGVEPSEWVFHSSWVFSRIDAFIQRLELIKKFFTCNTDYNRLEKVEALGVVGATLSQHLANLYKEYQDAYKNFTDLNMDCLSTENDVFLKKVGKYFHVIEDFDHRMTTIVLKNFSDCPDAASTFKTIFMFGPLLSRPVIAPKIDHCFYKLIEFMHSDLDECKLTLDRHLASQDMLKEAIFKNLPPASGAMAWSMQLLRRAEALMSPLRHIDHFFRKRKLDELCQSAPEKCQVNLKLPLLKRDPGTLLMEVNFDNQLIEILREVHYLLQMSGEGVCDQEMPPDFEGLIPKPVDEIKEKLPSETLELFEEAEPLREAHLKLNQIANAYNTVRQHTYTVEYPLISTEVEAFDKSLAPAFKNLTWKNHDMDFIDSNLDIIGDLRDRVLTAHENLQKISIQASLWNAIPLYQGKERKYDCLIPLEDRENIKESRYREMVDAAEKILRLVAVKYTLFFIISWSSFCRLFTKV
uniref:DHC_N1 domain-containing protein n=1 Tax=Mesocestoides corti TaxID=53468 RepID=A0A5K3EPX0_MESCO